MAQMTDKIRDLITSNDPAASISRERLDALELSILSAYPTYPAKRFHLKFLRPRLGMTLIIMLFLGMLVGQKLPTSSPIQQQSPINLAMAIPWQ